MNKSLSSLPQGFLAAYLRSQSEPVRSALFKVLGVSPDSKLNSSKLNKPEITPIP